VGEGEVRGGAQRQGAWKRRSGGVGDGVRGAGGRVRKNEGSGESGGEGQRGRGGGGGEGGEGVSEGSGVGEGDRWGRKSGG